VYETSSLVLLHCITQSVKSNVRKP